MPSDQWTTASAASSAVLKEPRLRCTLGRMYGLACRGLNLDLTGKTCRYPLVLLVLSS